MDPLASPGELETHLQRDVDASGAQLALTLASGAVRAYCGWDLAREETTFHVTADNTRLLTLPTLHLLTIAQIRTAGGDPVDPDLHPYRGSRKGQVWGTFSYSQDYEVDVVHGYDPIPDLIKLVVLDLASKNLNNPEGLVSATTASVSKTWQPGNTGPSMSALHERLLDRYTL